jgi:hypothetical protein
LSAFEAIRIYAVGGPPEMPSHAKWTVVRNRSENLKHRKKTKFEESEENSTKVIDLYEY